MLKYARKWISANHKYTDGIPVPKIKRRKFMTPDEKEDSEIEAIFYSDSVIYWWKYLIDLSNKKFLIDNCVDYLHYS